LAALNERGQVTGQMTTAGDVTVHPFLWDADTGIRDLGTLGGDFGSANWLNDAGEVVGWATNQGNQAALAFLWRNGLITDLGTVDGDQCSIANSINSHVQIVGISAPCDFSIQHVFLWEKGSILDLNALILPGSDLTLREPTFINDRGEIVGNGVLPNGDHHAFLLIPCDETHPNVEGCDCNLADPSAAAQVRAAPLTQPTLPATAQHDLSPAERIAQLRSPMSARHRPIANQPPQ
jgi:probable HAF family extracellular repeat protein